MDLYKLDNTLDWEVEERPIFDETGQPIDGYKHLINSKTDEVLHVCKSTFTPTKNEVLKEIALQLCEKGGFEIKGFASFKGGKRVMAYLTAPKLNGMLGLNVADYMILGNGNDGGSSFFTGLTNHVYRCSNMFSSTNKQIRITHTSGHENRINEAMNTVDLFFNARTGFYEQMEDFAQHTVGYSQRDEFANHVLGLESGEEISKRMENNKERLLESINRETSELGTNLFGLFNGVTHYTTHTLKQKSPIFGNPFGHAENLNRRAFEYCTEEATHKKSAKTMIYIDTPKNSIVHGF
jgi:hypothetical protein